MSCSVLIDQINLAFKLVLSILLYHIHSFFIAPSIIALFFMLFRRAELKIIKWLASNLFLSYSYAQSFLPAEMDYHLL